MARYSISFLPAASRELRKLPEAPRRALAAVIDGLADDPRPHGVESLSGIRGERIERLRWRDYRVLYQVRDRELVVLVVRVGDRRDVYDDRALERIVKGLRDWRPREE